MLVSIRRCETLSIESRVVKREFHDTRILAENEILLPNDDSKEKRKHASGNASNNRMRDDRGAVVKANDNRDTQVQRDVTRTEAVPELPAASNAVA